MAISHTIHTHIWSDIYLDIIEGLLNAEVKETNLIEVDPATINSHLFYLVIPHCTLGS